MKFILVLLMIALLIGCTILPIQVVAPTKVPEDNKSNEGQFWDGGEYAGRPVWSHFPREFGMTQELLTELEKCGLNPEHLSSDWRDDLKYSPFRTKNGEGMISLDDNEIPLLAFSEGGIVGIGGDHSNGVRMTVMKYEKGAGEGTKLGVLEVSYLARGVTECKCSPADR